MIQRDDFAVDQAVGETSSGSRDRRELSCPIETLAGFKRNLAARDAHLDPVTVQLDLMKPVGTFRGLFNERGELWLDPCWRVIRQGARLDESIV